MKFPEEGAKSESKGWVEETEGKTVVVGIKMDARSRELLTWALVNVAQPGDRVVALCVHPPTVEAPDSEEKPSSLKPLLKLLDHLDSVLAFYEGFCSLKKIDLKLKICRGSSIRKTLAQEAGSVSASRLILGISTNAHGLGSPSTSVAKYCARKLPRGCLVLVVNSGKIIFQKEATGSGSTHDLMQGNDFVKELDPVRPAFHLGPALSKPRLSCDRINGKSIKFLASSNESSTARKDLSSSEHSDRSLAEVPVEEIKSSAGCVSMLIRELPLGISGWPLLRRTILSQEKNSSQQPKTNKASLAQWAMWFPNKISTSPVVKPNAVSKSGSSGELGAILRTSPSFDGDEEEKEIIPLELLSLREKYSSICRLFSYNELIQATSNFSYANIVGEGGSSIVYKGRLSDGKELAVKISKPSEGVVKDFISEIEAITNLHHNNILSLYGFCFEKNNLALVYDFLSKGSLSDNLHDENGKSNCLGWEERHKIAIGVGEALVYLHGGSSEKRVIHRDVKSANILLSDDFNPQLSDFGLSQLASSSIPNTTGNDLAGTFGYLAPEYFMHGEVDEKVDVYAFGVVLLEILSGRKPVCTTTCSKEKESLVMWAKPILRGWKLEELVDPCLGNSYNVGEMERMCLAAFLCTRQAPQLRPCISLVVELLRGDDEAVKWAKLEFSSSVVSDGFDEEVTVTNSNIQSHINLALLGIDEDVSSTSSISQSVDFTTSNSSSEGERWSRSLSFD
ncbi:Receptor-like cytosolic serine/threonine-protein kinase RBK1 [Apostasia shenzhenica]|uniref:Receptor-like cytosolic serine/threonine-protein kinase RBK1 n=1 Tax=Apostasia shenzhenica TaxID=1088818 RepID=A0A2I0ANH7_9ASPA|nr:Receptor-like cytosolic serine/threonine-protein kinase RBK1 [Apostasia shenzhenica]